MTDSSVLLEKPTAVIFDLDGTLLDTEPLYTEASQQTIEPFGKTFDLSLKKKTMGGDARVSAQIIIDHFSLPMSVEDYLIEREAHLVKLFETAPEIKGAGQFVASLHKKNIQQGIATSSHQHLCDLKLAQRNWKSLISVIICGDHPALKRSKPEPDIFLLCAEKMGASPDECVAFEDSPKGIAAARAAGMNVVAINSPWVEKSDLRSASLIIDNFHQLEDLLAGW